MPSYPTQLTDPAGCGDSFAGAMAQYPTLKFRRSESNELAESLFSYVTASFTMKTRTERIRNLSIEI